MILYIDTTDNAVAEIAVIDSGKHIREHWQELPHAEEFAQAVQRFLRKHGYHFNDLSKIAVKVGPGFFSRVRTGVVAANALAYALNIKVIGVRGGLDLEKLLRQKGQESVLPVYGAKPNITKPKK